VHINLLAKASYFFWEGNSSLLSCGVEPVMITRCAIDQVSALKTRSLRPREISTSILRRLLGGKNRLKAERARFLSGGEESGA
jgi:hypothetical protein